MFFYLPFFTFVAAILLAFPDLAIWLGCGYLFALVLSRLIQRSR